MIPCDAESIHRWNAFDGLDDGTHTTDHNRNLNRMNVNVNDNDDTDLIVFGDDENQFSSHNRHARTAGNTIANEKKGDYDCDYEDPDHIITMDSFMSSASTVYSSEESGSYSSESGPGNGSGSDGHSSRGRGTTSKTSNYSNRSNRKIDEDGLILALDDRTNRMNRINGRITKPRSSIINNNDNDNNSNAIAVRVKKSVKYSNVNGYGNSQIVSRDENKNKNTKVSPAVTENPEPPRIATIHSDGSIAYSTDLVVRKENPKPIKPPRIATIHSDGSIAYSTDLVFRKENPEPTDGSIGYSTDLFALEPRPLPTTSALAVKPAPRVATINSDGSITYSMGSTFCTKLTTPSNTTTTCTNNIATDNNVEVVLRDNNNHKIKGNGNNSIHRKITTAIYTELEDEDNGNNNNDDDEEDLELADDICDNLDNSRYTRSLHSMPVLEEVTDEDSPLHADHANNKGSKGMVMVSPIATNKIEPTWLELRQSPSSTTTMTPKRTNDDSSSPTGSGNGSDVDTSSDSGKTPRWLKLSGHSSRREKSKKGKSKNGAKYQNMELELLDGETPRSNSSIKSLSCAKTQSSHSHTMLRVETCSTGSQSEDETSGGALDLESGGRDRVTGNIKNHNNKIKSKQNPTPNPNAKTAELVCGFRRRDWLAALVFVLIGITVGMASFLVMHRVFVIDAGARTSTGSGGGTAQNQDPNTPNNGGDEDRVFIIEIAGNEGSPWVQEDDIGYGFLDSGTSNDSSDDTVSSSSLSLVAGTETPAVTPAVTATVEQDSSEGSTTVSPNVPQEQEEQQGQEQDPTGVGTGVESGVGTDADTDTDTAVLQTTPPTIQSDSVGGSKISITAPPSESLVDTTTFLQTSSPTILSQETVTNTDSGIVGSMAPSDPPSEVAVFQTTSPTPSPTLSPTPSPTHDRLIPVIQDVSRINEVIRKARRQIEVMIFADDDLIGKFLRMVFHDCVGGCDGCIDLTNPENSGLEKPIAALQPIADEFEHQGLSRTDIWMLSSLVASELALPFINSDLTFPLHWVGRQTCEFRFAETTDPVTGHCGIDFDGNPTPCSPTRGPHVVQPHGTFGTVSIFEFFEDEFGFDAQQITAIMGAHSVGRMARKNVGFMGDWDLSSTTLDSGYWLNLVGNPPDYFLETVNNSILPTVPDRHQWRGILPDMNARTVAMMNVDVALVHNVQDMDSEGNVGCAGPGTLLKDCPSDTPFLPFATQYNEDERKFLTDFRDVLNILIDHGHAKAKPNPMSNTVCPEGRVCDFGKHPGTIDTFVVDKFSPPPTPSPSRAPPKPFPKLPEGQPKLNLDRSCYDTVGDTLVVTYDHVNGTDITFEIFSLEDVEILEGSTSTFSPRVSMDSANRPLSSSLSCGSGKSTCHTWTSRGGLQLSTETLVGDGNDYAVLLFARRSNDPIGDLQLLAGNSFRLEECNK